MRRMSDSHEETQSPPRPSVTLPSVTLVLPAYNKAERIGPALDELFAYLNGRPDAGIPASDMGPVEVLVVDDGSGDGDRGDSRSSTRNERRPSARRLRLFRERHTGKGGAVECGNAWRGTSDYILFADADLATPADQLPLLTDALASTTLPWAAESIRMVRRCAGAPSRATGACWAGIPHSRVVLGGRTVPDTQCGFKGFTARRHRTSSHARRSRSIVFDVELIHLARRRGYADRDRARPMADKRGSRMRAAPASRCRVAWDLVPDPDHPSGRAAQITARVR